MISWRQNVWRFHHDKSQLCLVRTAHFKADTGFHWCRESVPVQYVHVYCPSKEHESAAMYLFIRKSVRDCINLSMHVLLCCMVSSTPVCFTHCWVLSQSLHILVTWTWQETDQLRQHWDVSHFHFLFFHQHTLAGQWNRVINSMMHDVHTWSSWCIKI